MAITTFQHMQALSEEARAALKDHHMLDVRPATDDAKIPIFVQGFEAGYVVQSGHVAFFLPSNPLGGDANLTLSDTVAQAWGAYGRGEPLDPHTVQDLLGWSMAVASATAAARTQS